MKCAWYQIFLSASRTMGCPDSVKNSRTPYLQSYFGSRSTVFLKCQNFNRMNMNVFTAWNAVNGCYYIHLVDIMMFIIQSWKVWMIERWSEKKSGFIFSSRGPSTFISLLEKKRSSLYSNEPKGTKKFKKIKSTNLESRTFKVQFSIASDRNQSRGEKLLTDYV